MVLTLKMVRNDTKIATNNTWHFIGLILTPLPHVSFGDTGIDPSSPLPQRCDLKFLIFHKNKFFCVWKVRSQKEKYTADFFCTRDHIFKYWLWRAESVSGFYRMPTTTNASSVTKKVPLKKSGNSETRHFWPVLLL
jgi:hypothetical protein